MPKEVGVYMGLFSHDTDMHATSAAKAYIMDIGPAGGAYFKTCLALYALTHLPTTCLNNNHCLCKAYVRIQQLWHVYDIPQFKSRYVKSQLRN